MLMFHLFCFYAWFYLFTRFRMAYPSEDFSEDKDKNETFYWFAIWPVAIELFTFAWLTFEFYDYLNREKTSTEE